MSTNPDPVNSLLLDEPLERGIDVKRLHKEHDTYPAIFCLGLITTADSLAAIQKLVFDEQKYTMDELLVALNEDWEGYEAMHQDFLNAPKYGNDDDYADAWAVKLATRFENTISQVSDAWGYRLISDGGTAAGYQTAGMACGPSPDGRKAMSALTDGSLSPGAGKDRHGPTAVLNSAAKIPFMHTELFNQRFMPVCLEKENRPLFAAYLREWYEKGTTPHIQFNVVNNAVLRDAQEHPENYQDLQVRVAGYSARFGSTYPRAPKTASSPEPNTACSAAARHTLIWTFRGNHGGREALCRGNRARRQAASHVSGRRGDCREPDRRRLYAICAIHCRPDRWQRADRLGHDVRGGTLPAGPLARGGGRGGGADFLGRCGDLWHGRPGPGIGRGRRPARAD